MQYHKNIHTIQQAELYNIFFLSQRFGYSKCWNITHLCSVGQTELYTHARNACTVYIAPLPQKLKSQI